MFGAEMMTNSQKCWYGLAILGMLGNILLIVLLSAQKDFSVAASNIIAPRIHARGNKQRFFGDQNDLPVTMEDVSSKPQTTSDDTPLTFSLKKSAAGYITHKLVYDPNVLNEGFMDSINISSESGKRLQNLYTEAIFLVKNHEKKIAQLTQLQDESFFVIPTYAERLHEISDKFKKEALAVLAKDKEWVIELILSTGMFTDGYKQQQISAVLEADRIGSLVESKSGSSTMWDAQGLELLRARYGHLIDTNGLLNQIQHGKENSSKP